MKLQTQCGGTVLVPETTQDHLRAHPEMEESDWSLLREVIDKVTLPRHGLLETEVEMSRIVGKSGRVSTTLIHWTDKTTFAQRIGRDKPSRVVISEKSDCTTVVVIAKPTGVDGEYELATAWIGTRAPLEPWDSKLVDDKEYYASLGFWCREAIIYDPTVMGQVFTSTWKEVIEG